MSELKRFFAALLVLVCCALPLLSGAEMHFPTQTEGQLRLADYVASVNGYLTTAGVAPVNSLFVCTQSLAVFGVTDTDDAEIPESVEITVTMYSNALNVLTFRTSDPNRFAAIAAACICAAAPDGITWSEAMTAAGTYANRVKKTPDKSFHDTVNEQNGESVRTYYAYYCNQYGDSVNWLELTIIFPAAGYANGRIYVTPPPGATPVPGEYEGYWSEDPYTHFDISVTPTPEPDSPANE